METFTTLLALCAGNSPVTSEFPSQRPVTWNFDVFFDLRITNDWVNNRDAGDLRRYYAHYNVTVMHNFATPCVTAMNSNIHSNIIDNWFGAKLCVLCTFNHKNTQKVIPPLFNFWAYNYLSMLTLRLININNRGHWCTMANSFPLHI